MDRTQYTTLMEVLTQVPDYRKRKGRQHRWLTLLSLIAAAMASAQHTPQAIARWVREHRADLFAVLPATVSRLPSVSTIRRTLARLDVTALETALAAFHPLRRTRPHAMPISGVTGAGTRWQSRPWRRTRWASLPFGRAGSAWRRACTCASRSCSQA